MSNKDIFYLDKVFPEPSKVFSFEFKSLEEMVEDCVFILDTNVLFVPFDTSEKNLDEIKSILLGLKEENRLFLPARVVREFANNRAKRIGELFLKIRQSKNNLNSGHFKAEDYPLLQENENYKKVIENYSKIVELINDSRKLLNEVEENVLNWNWNDNVSQAYKEVFTSDIIVEVKKDNNELTEDLSFRIDHKIAPGYKDSGKMDDGIGDLIIWQTALEIAKEKSKDLILVSNDQKNDWFYKQDKEGLYPKYELFDEFRRFTDGQSMQIISFPKFLELQHARQETIDEVKEKIENIEYDYYPDGYSLTDLRKGLRIEHAKFGAGTIEELYRNSSNRDCCIISFDDGMTKPFMVNHTPMKIYHHKNNQELLSQPIKSSILTQEEALKKIDDLRLF